MQGMKKTLSKVWILNGSKPESERNYYFYCWFDSTVRVTEEFQEATTHCRTSEVVCNHKPEDDAAIIVGRGRYAYRNKDNVECVRSYFLEHGWKLTKP
jgi:hypothetical protein